MKKLIEIDRNLNLKLRVFAAQKGISAVKYIERVLEDHAYLQDVKICIENERRWDALRLIRDVRFKELPLFEREELNRLEMLAEESR